MTNNEALQILINAVTIGTRRGAFELNETEAILSAVKVFQTPPKEEDKTEKKK